MKKLFLSAWVIIFALISCKSENYNITGNFEGIDQGKVYLVKAQIGELAYIDSTDINGGAFEFTGSVDFPGLYALTADNVDGYLQFFLENTDITVNATADNFNQGSVSGSSAHDLFVDYREKMSGFEKRATELATEYRSLSEEGDGERAENLLAEKYEPLMEEMTRFQKDFVNDNPGSFVSPFILYSQLWNSLDINEKEKMLVSLDGAVGESPFVKAMEEELANLKRVDVGEQFVDFTMDDPEGNSRSFSSFVGDGYLLLDFTASWCGPCRSINPQKVELYNDFKEYGFDIVSVSLDRSHEAWVDYIEEDDLDWYHLSDLNAWDNEAAQIYGVRSIPHGILIDPDGVIVEKGISQDDLREKLNELLKD